LIHDSPGAGPRRGRGHLIRGREGGMGGDGVADWFEEGSDSGREQIYTEKAGNP